MTDLPAQNVRCPACGKGIAVAAADAGRPAVCRACGAIVETPAPPLLGPLGAGGLTGRVEGPPPAVEFPVPAFLPPGAVPSQVFASPNLSSPAPNLASPWPTLPAAAVSEPPSLPPSLTQPPPLTPPSLTPPPPSDVLSSAVVLPLAAEVPPLAGDVVPLDSPALSADVPPPVLGLAVDGARPWEARVWLPAVPPPAAPAGPPAVEPPSPFSPPPGLRTARTPGPLPSIPLDPPDVSAPMPLPPPSAVADGRLRPTFLEPPDPHQEDLVPLMIDRSGTPPLARGWADPLAPTGPNERAATVRERNPAEPDFFSASDDTNPNSSAARNPLPDGRGSFIPPPTIDDVALDPAEVRAVFAARAGGAHRAAATDAGRPIPRPAKRGPHPIWWAALGMIAAVAATFVLLVVTKQVDWFDSWEEYARPRVAELKTEAERLAVGGELSAAHARYQEIDEVIKGRPVRDPQLAALVYAAAEARQDLYRRILAAKQRQEEVAAAAEARRLQQEAAAARRSAPVTPPPVAAAVPGPVGPNPAVSAPNGVRPSPTNPPAVAKPAAPPAPAVVQRKARPEPRPISVRSRGVTDEEIGEAIQAGVNYLLALFDERTNTLGVGQRGNDNAYFAGMNALAVYALLQSGQAIDDRRLNPRDPRMAAMLEGVKATPIDGHHGTYARGIRATCLALYNRPDDFKTLAGDADWLVGTTDGGAYTYNGEYLPLPRRGNFASRGGSWDNSNSQYGVLGVWSAIEAEPRVEVPLAYWRAVAKHWEDSQNDDGRWPYAGNSSGRLNMTSAGIASLFVAHEYLEPMMTGGASSVGREPFPPALKKGLDWFERGSNSVSLQGGNWWGYGLYGIERVGLASGFKHFGTHDWYRELAQQTVRKQERNGSWGDGPVDTSYALLFLARGRHPILMNKLRFDGYWANRPREAANLARFATKQIERPINWQVVNADNPWTDWSDSPILYIASHEPPKLTDEHVEKMRKFIAAGGMVFTHADAGSPKFDAWARELGSKIFPPYELAPLPETHVLWSVLYKLQKRPPLLAVTNGSRILFLHSPSDLSLKWQQRVDRQFEGKREPGKPDPAVVVNPDNTARNNLLSEFQFGVNLFLYAAGRRDLRNRLDSAWLEAPAAKPIDTIRVARLRHTLNWDPEPGAWVRYANWFQWATGTRLEPAEVKMSELTADSVGTYPIAHLTGTAKGVFSQAEVEGLRAYVGGGGLVVIDPTGGMNGFDVTVREQLLPQAFPGEIPRLMDARHPALSAGASGMEDVGQPRVRMYTLDKLGLAVGGFQIVAPQKVVQPPVGGGPAQSSRPPGCVVMTSLDLTSGLLGTNTWGVFGYDPKYAQAVMKNLVFWAADGMPGL